MKKKIILGVLALLALVCLLSSVYTVEENQYACTVRFSKIIHLCPVRRSGDRLGRP